MTTMTDAQLKAKHRAMWASGDYPAVADAVIPDLGAVLVGACGVRAGDRVLDVAAGAGNAAIPAALPGATVVAADLTPELLEAGRRDARARGAELTWQVADAEDLPFDDGAFDVVLSCVGVMFAPDHDASARELLRVCRPGGTIGLISWTPAGFVGQLLAAVSPYAPPPPGARPALRWGEERYVCELLGGSVREFHSEHRMVRVDRLANAEELRDLFTTSYGPVVAVYRGLDGDAGRIAALDQDIVELARRHDLSLSNPVEGGPRRGRTPIVMDWEYLLVTAVRSAREPVPPPSP